MFYFVTKIKESSLAISDSVKGRGLGHLLPPLLLSPSCMFFSIILDSECFGTFFIRILGLKGYYDVMVHKRSF